MLLFPLQSSSFCLISCMVFSAVLTLVKLCFVLVPLSGERSAGVGIAVVHRGDAARDEHHKKPGHHLGFCSLSEPSVKDTLW